MFLGAGLSKIKLYADDTQVNLREVSSRWDTMVNFGHETLHESEMKFLRTLIQSQVHPVRVTHT